MRRTSWQTSSKSLAQTSDDVSADVFPIMTFRTRAVPSDDDAPQ
jgi:hypothetical protein